MPGLAAGARGCQEEVVRAQPWLSGSCVLPTNQVPASSDSPEKLERLAQLLLTMTGDLRSRVVPHPLAHGEERQRAPPSAKRVCAAPWLWDSVAGPGSWGSSSSELPSGLGGAEASLHGLAAVAGPYCRVGTPAVTSTVPTADRLVTLLLKTMTLSQMDRACFTVLVTLQESRKVSKVVVTPLPLVLGSYLLEQRSQRRGTTELGSIFRLSLLVPYFVSLMEHF